jgi:AcrR family transcriptional regulator
MSVVPINKTDSTKQKRLSAKKRKESLLNVALEVFSSKGYENTSMEEIAELAGVTKPIVYQHFDSKKSLYLELSNTVSSNLIDSIKTATHNCVSPKHQVEQGFKAYFNFVAMHASAFKLLFSRNAINDKELNNSVKNVEQTIANILAPLIDLQISDSHRYILASAIIGMAEGALRHWVNSSDFKIIRAMSREQQEKFLFNKSTKLAENISELAWAGLRGIKPVN